MKIEKIDTIRRESTRQENFHSDIVTRIFSICKTDPSFHLKKDIQIVENNKNILNKKIAKQDDLLNRSNEIKTDLLKRISDLENKNIDLKNTLLERLGSELWK
mgnify:CR=1 FL=1